MTVARKPALSFTVPVDEIMPAIDACASGTAPRSNISMLQAILIEAIPEGVILTASDGQGWVKRAVNAFVVEPGRTLINAKLLKDAVGLLSGELDFTIREGVPTLKSGKSTSKLMSLAFDEDFPEAPAYEGSWSLEVSAAELKSLHGQVKRAVTSDISRPALQGVQFWVRNGKLTLAATDTHRLKVARLDVEAEGLNIIVRPQDIEAILDLGYSDSEIVSLRGDSHRISAERMGSSIVAQLMQGTYPNWERVIPAERSGEWLVDKKDLAQAIKGVMPWASLNANRVRFQNDGEGIKVMARSEERGEAEIECDAEIAKPHDIHFAVNGRYALDMIDACPTDQIRIGFTQRTRPVQFFPADDSGWEGVIMTMALA